MHSYEKAPGFGGSSLKPASGAVVKETRSDKHKVSVSGLWLFVLV